MFTEGIYRVKATSWGFTETSNGNPRFWMGFDVLGIADPNRLDAAPKACDAGTGSWSITMPSDQNVDWLVSTVRHLGYDGDNLLRLDPDEPGAFNFEGKEFYASCKHEEYKEQTRAKWSVFKPRNKTKPAKDRLLALNERFRATVKEEKARQAQAVPSVPTTVVQPTSPSVSY